MDLRLQIVSIVAVAALFGLVLELVRRRRLMERYALLWLISTAGLLALALWGDLLDLLAGAVGVAYAPSALFAATLVLVLGLLLHFSLVISRLTDQCKVLAQRVGTLQHEIDELAAAPRAVEEPADEHTGERLRPRVHVR